MLVVVTTVSALVHLYSIGYMHEDPSRPRFFAYLSLFTFAMLMLVTADNLVQMFFGWEGVGLASYLLIGFWYQKPSANAAAIKAFVVNRVGDFGFTLGIFLVFVLTNSVTFDPIFAAAPGLAHKTIHVFGGDFDAMTITCLLLFMGAMGKSAQFLLHTWLPDAMEGPTPVSALIHAATMVTAGVFMVARLSPLFEQAPDALCLRHLHRRHDGLLRGDRRPRAKRHQARHRLFDLLAAWLHVRRPGRRRLFARHFPSLHACLLQGAAVPRRRLGHHRDASRAGHAQDGRSCAAKFPLTFLMMMVGTLALTGFPLTAGYFSKDAIIEASYAGHGWTATYAFILVTIAAGLTSFYSWRLVFMTFFGPAHWQAAHDDHARCMRRRSHAANDAHADPHAARLMTTMRITRMTIMPTRLIRMNRPRVMMIPLYVLALRRPVGRPRLQTLFHRRGRRCDFWKSSLFYGPANHILEAMEHVPPLVSLFPTLMMVGGFFVALYVYILAPGTAQKWADAHAGALPLPAQQMVLRRAL